LFRLFASLRLCSDPANQPIFKEPREMKPIRILAILCLFAPSVAVAQDGRPKPVVTARKAPAWGDYVAPGVLRQDLFSRNNPNNLRHDYPSAPAQPGQF
jgi:hypothetical protein